VRGLHLRRDTECLAPKEKNRELLATDKRLTNIVAVPSAVATAPRRTKMVVVVVVVAVAPPAGGTTVF
jgi:hypothetical protein